MRLDRNLNKSGEGKYALLRLRQLREMLRDQKGGDRCIEVENALITLKKAGLVHFGDEGEGEQFFVLKYKDVFAAPALRAYAKAIFERMGNAFQPEIAGKILNGDPLRPDEEEQRTRTAQLIKNLEPYWRDLMAEADAAMTAGSRLPD